MKLRHFITENIRKLINEGHLNGDNNLTLYHGSNNQKIYTHFLDNQFYTVNDYIASNYAYNFGGLMYEVHVSSLKPFELKSYNESREPEKYRFMINLLTELYDDRVAENYKNRYFTPSPSSTFMNHGWTPMINWAKENGYDSLKFTDESFDTFVHDTTYLIFKDNHIKIKAVYDVTEAVESNFSKPMKKINN